MQRLSWVAHPPSERHIMNFRTNLSYLRTSYSMTQEQLAMLLGVSRQSVTKWESGKSTPEMDKLLKLCEIFSCTLDELVCGDLTGREAQAFQPATSAPVDLCGYDEERTSFAWHIALGVGCFILGPALLCLIQSAGEALGVAAKISEVVGVIGQLGLTAVGLALIIPAGMRHAAFVKDHPYIEDFYTAEEREQCRENFIRQLVGGILLILAGVGLCVLVESLLGKDTLGAGLLLGCVALGVWSIIHGALLWGGMDVDAYNVQSAEFAESSVASDGSPSPKGRRERITSGLCGAIMLIATIAGLTMLFVPGYTTPYFWLAWPLGGLLCGVVSCLTSAFVARD